MNSSDPPGIAKLAEAAATSCTSLHILYPIFLILINPNHPPHQKWLDRTQPRVLAPLTSQIPPCLGLIPQRGQQAGKDFGMRKNRKNMCPLPPEHEASSQISDFSLHYLPMGCSMFVYSHSQHKTMETWGNPVSKQLGLGTSSHHQIDTISLPIQSFPMRSSFPFFLSTTMYKISSVQDSPLKNS